MAEEDIYKNRGAINMRPTSDLGGEQNVNNASPSGGPEEAPVSMSSGAVRKNYTRWSAVCLGLLSVLLLALNIGQGVKYITEKGQFQAETDHLLAGYVNVTMEKEHLDTDMEHLLASYAKLTTEREKLDVKMEHLLASYVNVSIERDQLDAEKEDLLANYVNVSIENSEFSATYTNLTRQVEELRITNGQLQARISKLEKRCPSRWRYFNTKCYLISSSRKTWSESRHHCKDSGGDLVIINSKVEQVFIHGLVTVWIGLRKSMGEWKWVDNTELSTKYWGKGQPDDAHEDCVLIETYVSDPFSSWHDYPCSLRATFICEMPAFI